MPKPMPDNNAIPDDEPLDPKVEAIRRKMVTLLAVSGGIMAVGLATVLIAIVYKLQGPAATTATALSDIALPAGSTILSGTADDTGLSLTITGPDGTTEVHRYDQTGARKGLYRIQTR